MTPKWLYVFNHYLMVVSLVGLIAIVLLEFGTMPFWKTFSDATFNAVTGIFNWGFPILLALFVVSSGVVVSDFAKHRIEIKPKGED